MCVSQIIWLSWKRLELVIIVRKQFSSSLKLLFNKLRGEYAGRVVYVSGGSDLGKKMGHMETKYDTSENFGDQFKYIFQYMKSDL